MFTSLYIHVPFCHRKCDYCAFYSLGSSTAAQHDLYLDKLERDFAANAPACAPLQSVFIGGGTPSVLDTPELQRLLSAVHAHFILAPDCEWSCEANPESLTDDKLELFAQYGVTRISLGVQSFLPAERDAIGRRGSLDNLPHIRRTLECLAIREVNFDLMFLLPGQSPDSFAESLRRALDLAPTHLSAYALTIEEHSVLGKRHAAVDDTLFEAFWNTADNLLANAGLHRYEISNFALPGHRCRHNYDIWHGATYLGCGPAATSFDGHDRFTQPPSLTRWLDGEAPEHDALPPAERACEILAFAMRTTDGWDFRDFQRLTGFSAHDLRGSQLQRLSDQGLLTLSPHHAAPTRLGLLFNDTILENLI